MNTQISALPPSEDNPNKSSKCSSDSSNEYAIDYKLLDTISLEQCREVEGEFNKEFKLLEKCLNHSDFGVGPHTIGCELEMFLLNEKSMLPSLVNVDICNEVDKQKFQPEISKFCLEFNGPILPIDQQPLLKLNQKMQSEFDQVNKLSKTKYNTEIALIGILPTLTSDDLGIDALTPHLRYYAIDKILRSMRKQRDFIIDIDGEDPLIHRWHNTLLEGVNSSYQTHLRVNPKDFNDYYNATQLVTAFALSISCNSPMLFGHRLWEETRIPVFEQTVNNHNTHLGPWLEHSRVAFGRGWIKDGALGLLKDTCELFYPIYPNVANYTKNNFVGGENLGPNLEHVVKHNSTVWPWNRAIYDRAFGGHFRIETRFLPAGPTITDMIANNGFLLGLVKYYSKHINKIVTELPFKYAQYNFYQAAQYGLNAKFIWHSSKSKKLEEIPAIALLPDMIKHAAAGLQEFGVSDAEVRSMQDIISQRLESGITGSTWQKTIYNKLLAQNISPEQAVKQMFTLYLVNQKKGLPVGMWKDTM